MTVCDTLQCYCNCVSVIIMLFKYYFVPSVVKMKQMVFLKILRSTCSVEEVQTLSRNSSVGLVKATTQFKASRNKNRTCIWFTCQFQFLKDCSSGSEHEIIYMNGSLKQLLWTRSQCVNRHSDYKRWEVYVKQTSDSKA